MAKGVSQEQVNTAADALVSAGERPTVERIRAFLGTGSPNTVTRMLEAWWQGLGARLSAQQSKLELPGAPEAVSMLAGQLWEQALSAAAAQAELEVAGFQAELNEEKAHLESSREALRQAETLSQAALDAAKQAQMLAEGKLAETLRLVEQQAAQILDLQHQREALTARTESLSEQVGDLHDRLRAQESSAAAERDGQAQHLRAVEDRAHQEIDRARQETKVLQRTMQASAREHASALEKSKERLAAAKAATSEALRQAAREEARARVLEQQLAKLADLPASLEATLAKVRVPRRVTSSATAQPKKAARKAARSRAT